MLFCLKLGCLFDPTKTPFPMMKEPYSTSGIKKCLQVMCHSRYIYYFHGFSSLKEKVRPSFGRKPRFLKWNMGKGQRPEGPGGLERLLTSGGRRKQN